LGKKEPIDLGDLALDVNEKLEERRIDVIPMHALLQQEH